jgi:hypothetical protein
MTSTQMPVTRRPSTASSASPTDACSETRRTLRGHGPSQPTIVSDSTNSNTGRKPAHTMA